MDSAGLDRSGEFSQAFRLDSDVPGVLLPVSEYESGMETEGELEDEPRLSVSIARAVVATERPVEDRAIFGAENLVFNYQLVFSCFLVIITLFF